MSAAFADFNNDGNLDVLTATGELLLGTKTPGFTGPTSIGTSGGLAVAGDFNGDGKADVAIASAPGVLPATISVLLGNGDGSFGSPTVYNLDGIAFALAVADVNKDGHLDLIAAINFLNEVTVLTGSGNGTFPTVMSTTIPDTAGGFARASNALAVADFNGDGYPDVAVLQDQGVAVLPGMPGGTFGSPSFVMLQNAVDPTLGFPLLETTALLAADVNGDHKADLVVGFQSSRSAPGGLAGFAGNGEGTFGPQTSLNLLAAPVWLVSADVNGDQIPDVVGCNAGGTIAIASGISGGGLQAPETYVAGSLCSQVFGGPIDNAGGSGIAMLGGSAIPMLGEPASGDALVTLVLRPAAAGAAERMQVFDRLHGKVRAAVPNLR
jgi:hypothetical protein